MSKHKLRQPEGSSIKVGTNYLKSKMASNDSIERTAAELPSNRWAKKKPCAIFEFAWFVLALLEHTFLGRGNSRFM